MKRKYSVLGIIIVVVIAIAVSVFFVDNNKKHKETKIKQTKNKQGVYNNLYIKDAVKFLDSNGPTEDIVNYPVKELQIKNYPKEVYNSDVMQPVKTNQWFSSLYFKEGSESIFAFPLAFRFENDELLLSTPVVTEQDDLIMGAFTSDVRIKFDRNIKAVVSSYGDFSVKVVVVALNDSTKLAEIMFTHGSPYVFLDIESEQSVKVSSVTHDSFVGNSKNTWFTSGINKRKYGIVTNLTVEDLGDSNTINENVLLIKNNTKLKRGVLTIGVLPVGVSQSKFIDLAKNIITDTKVHILEKGGKFWNVFDLKTRNNKETFFGLLPHHQAGLIDEDKINCAIGSVNTIRGNQKFCTGKTFVIRSNFNMTPNEFLDVSNYNNKQKSKLKNLIIEDVRNFKGFQAKDTYFLGKEVLRIANIYDLAKQLDMNSEANVLEGILIKEFAEWNENTKNNKQDIEKGKYFVYDNKIKGIIGQKTSFGSEEFNDHHFHYGYFVHAGAILAKYDETFIGKYGEIVNLFLNDYLNIDRNRNDFAFVRDFDFYEGHSWAAGTGMFGDGNNQESSSEAVHAYYAGYLWGKAINNNDLTNVARWLYNQESDTALTYWMLATKYSPVYKKYSRSVVSLVWGGKSEFSTWFSGEAEAKVGIQLIPFSAGSEYLDKIDKSIVGKHLAETAFPSKKMFFDQLLMYQAISDAHKALSYFENVNDSDIDGGNSRSFLYAWIINHLKQ